MKTVVRNADTLIFKKVLRWVQKDERSIILKILCDCKSPFRVHSPQVMALSMSSGKRKRDVFYSDGFFGCRARKIKKTLGKKNLTVKWVGGKRVPARLYGKEHDGGSFHEEIKFGSIRPIRQDEQSVTMYSIPTKSRGQCVVIKKH